MKKSFAILYIIIFLGFISLAGKATYTTSISDGTTTVWNPWQTTISGGAVTADGDGSATVTVSAAPTSADYLVGTSNATLTNEIIVGTSPGGELGNTWASPTIDDSVAVTSWNLTTPTITTSLTTSTPTTLAVAELDRLDGLTGIIVTDTTACTEIDGTNLTITTGTLNVVSHAGTDIEADLEEEVTEGSLADSTIVSADIKDGEIVTGDISGTAGITMAQTALVAGTNITLSTNTLNIDDFAITNNAADLLSASTDATTLLILRNTDASLAAETYILELQQTMDADANADFFKCTDAYGGSPATLFLVEYDGDVTVGKDLTATGDITGNNLSGTNTGDNTLAATVTIADNESTDENNAIVFLPGGDLDGGNLALECDGSPFTYNPSSGTVTATTFVGALTGNASGSSGSCTGNSATATLATTLTITDNESTAENNAILFTSGGDLDGGNLGIESDGTCYYTPSTGKITATGFVGALTGQADTVATITGLAPDTQNTYARTQYLIPYAATTTSWGQIAIGTDGQVLTSGGAGVAPAFEAAPAGAYDDIGDPDAAGTIVFGAHTNLWQHTVGELFIIENTSDEDTDGGRETIIAFKGDQSGAEVTTLAEIKASHDGTADDTKGKLTFHTNDGNDADAPTEHMEIDSLGIITTVKNSGVRAYRDASVQADIVNATWTKVEMNGETYDIQGEYDPTTNYRFTATVGGYYLVCVSIRWDALAADKACQGGIYLNGSIYVAQQLHTSITSSVTNVVVDIIPVSAGDYIEAYCWHSNGDNEPDVANDWNETWMSITKER